MFWQQFTNYSSHAGFYGCTIVPLKFSNASSKYMFNIKKELVLLKKSAADVSFIWSKVHAEIDGIEVDSKAKEVCSKQLFFNNM